MTRVTETAASAVAEVTAQPLFSSLITDCFISALVVKALIFQVVAIGIHSQLHKPHRKRG